MSGVTQHMTASQLSEQYHSVLKPSNKPEHEISQVTSTDEKYELKLSIHEFEPHELSVKVVDRYVHVNGRHEEKNDKIGFFTRKFTRSYFMPEGTQQASVRCTFNIDTKVLTVTAPIVCKKPCKEYIIPVIIVGSQRDTTTTPPAPAAAPAPTPAPPKTPSKRGKVPKQAVSSEDKPRRAKEILLPQDLPPPPPPPAHKTPPEGYHNLHHHHHHPQHQHSHPPTQQPKTPEAHMHQHHIHLHSQTQVPQRGGLEQPQSRSSEHLHQSRQYQQHHHQQQQIQQHLHHECMHELHLQQRTPAAVTTTVTASTATTSTSAPTTSTRPHRPKQQYPDRQEIDRLLYQQLLEQQQRQRQYQQQQQHIYHQHQQQYQQHYQTK